MVDEGAGSLYVACLSCAATYVSDRRTREGGAMKNGPKTELQSQKRSCEGGG